MTSHRHATRFRMYVTVLAIILILFISTGVGLASSIPATQTSLAEWTVPTPRSGPYALTLDQSGNCCWFLEYFGNKVSHFDPDTGLFQEWSIPTAYANPYSLAITSVGGAPMIWGTEYGADKIFAFLPTSGTFLEYSLRYYGSGVGYISIEPSAQLRVWFTETSINMNGEFVYDPKTENVTYYEDAFPPAAGGGAYGVLAGSDAVWFAGFSALVKWDRASLQYTMWPLPNHGLAVGQCITIDASGQVWYTQGSSFSTSDDNFVGVLRGSNTLQEWRIPSSGSDPRGITIDPLTQQPWIAESSSIAGNGTIATLDNYTNGTILSSSPVTAPSGGTPTVLAPARKVAIASNHTVTSTSAPILPSPTSSFTNYALGPTQPYGVVADSRGNVWISETGANKIARLTRSGSDFALTANPTFISLSPGTSTTVMITGKSISGYSGAVTLTTRGLPAGVTLTFFNQNSFNIPTGGNASSSAVINVASNTPPGTSSFIIQGNNGPITHAVGIVIMIANITATTASSSKPQCLIATATYGSEMSPQVQLLRSFRDNLLNTKSGSSFLIIFNAWYYSFSPYVAQYITSHSVSRELMKGVLYPLIGCLFLASELHARLSAYPESATILSGLLASFLIGAFYMGLPFAIIMRRLRLRSFGMRSMNVMLLAGLTGILLGQHLASTALLMLSASVTVLSAMFSAATITAVAIGGILEYSRHLLHYCTAN